MQPKLGDIVWYHFSDREMPVDGIVTTKGRVVNVYGNDLVDIVVGNSFKQRVARGDKPNDPAMIRAAWSEIAE